MGYEYMSILDWIYFRSQETVMASPFYPYAGDNLPYMIGYRLAEVILGLIGWLLGLIINCWRPEDSILISDWMLNAIAVVLEVVVIFGVGFIVNLTMIWEERKILGRTMDRRATRIGPLGYLQCLADGLKTFCKENIAPKAIDKKVYWWGLSLVIGTSVLIACMVPLSSRWYIVNFDAGLLIIFGLFALAPFLILCAGWAQNNKYSLIGGMRAAELMISYEVPMLIMLATVCLAAETYTIGGIVQAQFDNMWYVVPQVIGFFAFLVAAIAESERVPFDLSEAEAELVEGWQTEYAGMKWGLIMLGDYFRGYVACAFIVILYLGGWMLPVVGETAVPELIFIGKVCLVFAIFALARGAYPRVRTDQILNIGWKVLMPMAIINLALVVVLKTVGWF
jgi:NADH-quinone oxidoreductase subunit H